MSIFLKFGVSEYFLFVQDLFAEKVASLFISLFKEASLLRISDITIKAVIYMLDQSVY